MWALSWFPLVRNAIFARPKSAFSIKTLGGGFGDLRGGYFVTMEVDQAKGNGKAKLKGRSDPHLIIYLNQAGKKLFEAVSDEFDTYSGHD